MTTRPGSRRDVNRFCECEGWELVRNGKAVRPHVTWELRLPTGAVLRTRISRPLNVETYGPQLWSAILADQLGVDETTFWPCVDDGVIPDRAPSPAAAPKNALPVSLVRQLQAALHLSDAQLAELDLATAVELMNQHWSTPPDA